MLHGADVTFHTDTELSAASSRLMNSRPKDGPVLLLAQLFQPMTDRRGAIVLTSTDQTTSNLLELRR